MRLPLFSLLFVYLELAAELSLLPGKPAGGGLSQSLVPSVSGPSKTEEKSENPSKTRKNVSFCPKTPYNAVFGPRFVVFSRKTKNFNREWTPMDTNGERSFKKRHSASGSLFFFSFPSVGVGALYRTRQEPETIQPGLELGWICSRKSNGPNAKY